MPLTFVAIKNAKPRAKPYKLPDGSGLYIEVTPTDRRYWRLKYRHAGKEKKLAIGVFPEVSIKEAREAREAARKLLAAGLDPSLVKQARKASATATAENSFKNVATEWFEKTEPKWVASHSSKIIRRLELHVFPYIGKRPIDQVTAPEVLALLQRLEGQHSIETAHRALNNCSAVMRYAISTGRASVNPLDNLRGALASAQEVHHAAITEESEVGALLLRLRAYKGSEVVKHALLLAPLLFVRPGELRRAEWAEFDMDKKRWVIPANKMKMRREHIVPLASQALQVLTSLRKLTGDGQFLFPSVRDKKRVMSENTVNAALRYLGYTHDQHTGHGFRSMASTGLNTLGFNGDHIELQLAHVERNSIRRAYNHAQHLPERASMMQRWADHLDQLAAKTELKKSG